MWTIKYKPNNDSQAWLILESYDNKSQALLHAACASGGYFKVNVVDPDYNIIWRNEN
ncbi:hypothetical protein MNBD_GAMMA05-2038 [hydrothermal vent metagenome]|uniref:Uncharacterized protein n=1 Tax=hydrothermal vent metagenome TaxID=652676 RepID=A0A3B0WRY0_9ZZZZ